MSAVRGGCAQRRWPLRVEAGGQSPCPPPAWPRSCPFLPTHLRDTTRPRPVLLPGLWLSSLLGKLGTQAVGRPPCPPTFASAPRPLSWTPGPKVQSPSQSACGVSQPRQAGRLLSGAPVSGAWPGFHGRSPRCCPGAPHARAAVPGILWTEPLWSEADPLCEAPVTVPRASGHLLLGPCRMPKTTRPGEVSSNHLRSDWVCEWMCEPALEGRFLGQLVTLPPQSGVLPGVPCARGSGVTTLTMRRSLPGSPSRGPFQKAVRTCQVPVAVVM